MKNGMKLLIVDLLKFQGKEPKPSPPPTPPKKGRKKEKRATCP